MGQPYFREVAQDAIKTMVAIRKKAAVNLFFICGYFAVITKKGLYYFTNIGLDPHF
jgi:hypothetical protein